LIRGGEIRHGDFEGHAFDEVLESAFLGEIQDLRLNRFALGIRQVANFSGGGHREEDEETGEKTLHEEQRDSAREDLQGQ